MSVRRERSMKPKHPNTVKNTVKSDTLSSSIFSNIFCHKYIVSVVSMVSFYILLTHKKASYSLRSF